MRRLESAGGAGGTAGAGRSRDNTGDHAQVREKQESALDRDEDTFVPSAKLTRHRLRRRDRPVAGGARRRPDHAAAETLESEIRRHLDRVRAIVEWGPSPDSALRTAAHRYLAGETDPVGAAAVAHAMMSSVWRGSTEHRPSLVASAWITRHGVAFAAEAAVALVTIVVRFHKTEWSLAWRNEWEILPSRWFGQSILAEVRTALARAGEEEYASAVAGMASYRSSQLTRATTAFLAPTEADWVAAAVRDAVGSDDVPSALDWLWICAVGTLDQARAIERRLTVWGLDFAPYGLPTLVTTIGPGVAPLLAELADRDLDPEITEKILSALAELPTDEAFQLLAERSDHDAARPFVQEAMRRFPRRARRVLAGTRGGEPLLRELLAMYPELTDSGGLDPDIATVVSAVAMTIEHVPDAPVSALPPVLADPPWKRPRRGSRPPVLALEAPGQTRLVWRDGERESWAAAAPRYSYGGRNVDWPKELEAVLDGSIGRYREVYCVLSAPDNLVAPMLPRWRPRTERESGTWGRALLGRYGEPAVTPLLSVAGVADPESFAILVPVLDARVAMLMAEALARSKSVRPHALAWLSRHEEEGVALLVPTALGRPGRGRVAAENVIRIAARTIGHDAVVAAAHRYGAEAVAAIETLVSRDPHEDLPARLPTIGTWAHPALLPRIRLRDGTSALSVDATADVLTMLSVSGPGEPYAGLAQVAEVAAPGVLSAFGWGLFERWQAVGYPKGDGWVLAALGHLGDDDTVRRLAPLIRTWPGEGGHRRAVAGLAALADIGTDAALTHLNDIALTTRFAGLRKKAHEKIAQVADGLGLSPEQLADRLVPDLGLDGDGGPVLDYGPRRFTVGLDERFTLYAVGTDGVQRASLPRPGVHDDPELASAARTRFAALKKEARSVLAAQVRRLERAMVTQRRWSTEEFQRVFVAHPLLRRVALGVVWAVYGGEQVTGFRLTADGTPVGVEDAPFPLPDTAMVGLAHPLQLGEALPAWADVFAGHGIRQPFPQLARPVLRLTDEEREQTHLARFEGSTVATGRVLALLRRGWERGKPQDGGVEPWVVKPLPYGKAVVLHLDPGIVAGDVATFEEQRIDRVTLEPAADGWYGGGGYGTEPFHTVDPVTECEVVADLTEALAGREPQEGSEDMNTDSEASEQARAR